MYSITRFSNMKHIYKHGKKLRNTSNPNFMFFKMSITRSLIILNFRLHTFERIVCSQLERITFLCYGGYKMSHVNNNTFPENMFALSFLYTIEDTFGKRKQHKIKELSIPRE